MQSGDSEEPGGGCGGGEPCGSGLERVYPTTAVRYGQMGYIGEFTRPKDMKFGCAVSVVVQTRRGIEIGEQVSLTCSDCDRSVSRDQIIEYASRSGSEYYELDCGRILRFATEQDLADYERINADSEEKHRFCQELADRLKLGIRLVSCEHLFGGERIIFFFVAEGRVDFRALVKGLAREYQTRIEMRQIGARDEARLVADYETCGRECCCRNFLKSLKPVSMKMAKLQKATLDPSKVSGRCGRLRCCLRYEHSSYEELDRRLPRAGNVVRTRHGEGRVVARQILTQLIQVETATGGRFAATVEDLLGPDESSEPEPARPPERAEESTARLPQKNRRDDKGEEETARPSPADQPPQEGKARSGNRGRRRRKKRASSSGGEAASEAPSPQGQGAERTPAATPSATAAAGQASGDRPGPTKRRRKRRLPRGQRRATQSGRGSESAHERGKPEAGPPQADRPAPGKSDASGSPDRAADQG